jgi:hypothetical protein
MSSSAEFALLAARNRIPGIERRIVTKQPSAMMDRGLQRLRDLEEDLAEARRLATGSAALDPTLAAKLNEARSCIPKVKGRIVASQSQAGADQGIGKLRELDAALGAALQILEVKDDSDPDLDPISIPTSGFIGGPVGSQGRTKIENKTFTDEIDLEEFENTDFHRCTFKNIDGRAIDGRVGRNIRLLDCVFENIEADHVIYVNNGHEEEEIGLVIQGARLVRCKGKTFCEFKASDVTVADCVQDPSCKFAQTLRFRHGRKHIVVRNKGFGEISCRGWLKWIVDNPGAKVVLWSGNLPYRYKDWKPLHKAGGGNNMQGCELAYVADCGSVEVGKLVGAHNQFPALNCIIDPGMTNIHVDNAKPSDPVRKHFTQGFTDLGP